MHPLASLIPLSLLLSILTFVPVQALHAPFTVRTSARSNPSLSRRANTSIIPLANSGNAQYIANITMGGQNARVLLDTGSSDLWVSFPSTQPQTKDLGKSLKLEYAIGSATGKISTAQMIFDNYTVEDQAFLLVTDTSSFTSDIHSQGYDGLMGLGPNEGSQILDEINEDTAASVLERIFTQDKKTDNFISFLLDRKGDPTADVTGQFTISQYVPGFENISSMPKLDVESVHKLLQSDQHWQALTDKDNGLIGPDGQPINIDSIVPKAPDGQLVAVFDSGFTFTQVPRDLSDAIYGRVQGAIYDSKNQWWTVPCKQMLNITFNLGGKPYPIHPLDVVDASFNIKDANGNEICIGTFQPITSAFSILGNYDMIFGMSFLRNTYTLLDFGDFIEGGQGDPYIQLLSVTDPKVAHSDFVSARLGGVDTTGDPQYALLPADKMQHSPVSDEEKKKKYQEMILSRWPYILTGCLVFVVLVVGCCIWRCCCRKNKDGKKMKMGGLFHKKQKPSIYLPLQVQGSTPKFAESGHGYNGHGYGQHGAGHGFKQYS